MRFYETSILLMKFTKHKFCQFTKYEAEDKEINILIYILWTSANVRCFLIPMTYKAGCELSKEWYPPWEEQCESWDKHIKMTGLWN